jgi:heat-inducible transcriptional repressor
MSAAAKNGAEEESGAEGGLRQVLTERRAAILQLIVDDYVRSAVPVGSENIVRAHGLGLSSATLRNEMARLEEEGYISHPHTSAGRVPSDKGYRYYVESLMRDPDISDEEKLRILHQFHQAATEIPEWLQLAASVLAHSASNLAVVTAPRGPAAKLKHIQLIELNETTALLVLVTEDIKLHQQVLALPEPLTQEELTRLSARLNQRLSGKGAEAIRAEAARAASAGSIGEPHRRAASSDENTSFEDVVIGIVADTIAMEDSSQYAEPHLEGIGNVLRQPEFSRSDRMLDVLEALEERNLAKVIPFETLAEQGVTVIIGAENRRDAMRDCSVVMTRYSAGDDGPTGAIGVVGPTRMYYPRAIATVRYLGALLSDLMTRLYE